MNSIDKQYQELLNHILHRGVVKEDRTGTGAISIFGWQIRHKMEEGFPLLTTKKMAWKSIMTELMWFLKGDTNIKYLVDNDCHIWNGDAYKKYKNVYDIESRESTYALEDLHMLSDLTKEQFIERIKNDDKFAKKWGELGPIYGKQWRDWNYQSKKNHYVMAGQPTHHNIHIDQIVNLISELKSNPDSRRLMVSAWNVGELDKMVLPPCHYGFQVYTRELSVGERVQYVLKDESDDPYYERQVWNQELIDKKVPTRAISLMWNQRSVDTFLGLPFNIASYALLLEIIAKEVNMIPDELIGNLGDTHLYLNHVEQAREQISRTPFKLPTLKFNPIFLTNLEHKGLDEAINGQVNFELENYQSHPAIKAPLSN
jgi:thymidylate synthase